MCRTPLEPPADHVESPPAKPQLKVMTWSGEDGDGVQVPQDVVTKWALNPNFGEELQVFLVEVTNRQGKSAASLTPSKKRGAAATGPDSAKRQKTEAIGPAFEAVEAGKLPGAELVEARFCIV